MCVGSRENNVRVVSEIPERSVTPVAALSGNFCWGDVGGREDEIELQTSRVESGEELLEDGKTSGVP